MAQVLLRSTLAERSLARVLFVLFRKRSTAIIKIGNDWRLYTRDGMPVDADVPGATDTLGRVLFELGLITSEAYHESLTELAKGGRLHGQILLASGALDAAGLARGLAQQVLRKLTRAMTLERGVLEVIIDEHRRGARADSPRVDPRLVIHHGVRRSYSAERVAHDLAVLEGKAVRLVAGLDLGPYGLLPDDRGVCELLGTAYHTIDDLRTASGRQATSALMITYCLMVTEALDVRDLGDVPDEQRANVQETSASAATTTPVASKRPSGPVPRISGREAAAVRERIRSKVVAIERGDLFAALELPDLAPIDEVRRAYFALAKVFHPDRLLAQGLDDLQSEAARVLARVNEAFATLSDARRRTEYLARRGAGDLRAKQDAEDAEAQRILTAEFSCEKAEIMLKRRDFPAALEEARRAVELMPGEGRYQAVAAWASWMGTPEADKPAAISRIRSALDKAVRDAPKFANGHFWLAQIVKQAGDEAAAFRHFNEAHKLDPRNLDAEREVRLHNMRKQKSR